MRGDASVLSIEGHLRFDCSNPERGTRPWAGGACRDTAALAQGDWAVAETTTTETVSTAPGSKSTLWRVGAVGRKLS